MSENVILPKWGLTMEEGTVTAWRKQEGEPVAEGPQDADVLMHGMRREFANSFFVKGMITVERFLAQLGGHIAARITKRNRRKGHPGIRLTTADEVAKVAQDLLVGDNCGWR